MEIAFILFVLSVGFAGFCLGMSYESHKNLQKQSVKSLQFMIPLEELCIGKTTEFEKLQKVKEFMISMNFEKSTAADQIMKKINFELEYLERLMYVELGKKAYEQQNLK
jgi:hypothetical protein